MPLGEDCIVELLPIRWIRRNTGNTCYLARKAPLPGRNVDEMLTKRPATADVAPHVFVRGKGEGQLGDDRVEPSSPVAQQVEEGLAIHAGSVSGTRCQ